MSAPHYTAEFVERGYNNRAAVPEHPHWFARWAAMSAAAKDALRPAQDLRYGDGPKETLDLFVPPYKGLPNTLLNIMHRMKS